MSSLSVGEKTELLFFKLLIEIYIEKDACIVKCTAQIFYPLEFSQAEHICITSIQIKK